MNAPRLAVALAAIASLALAHTARAADDAPCGHTSVRKVGMAMVTQNCPIFVPSGGVPVTRFIPSARRAGTLHQGGNANWFVCQTRGRSASDGASHNVWWALTESDEGRRGWVNEVYFSGGGNDQADATLRRCGRHAFVWARRGHAGRPTATRRRPDPTRCTTTAGTDRQRIQIDAALRQDFFKETYGVEFGGKPDIRRIEHHRFRLGDVVLYAGTCRRPNGRWQLLPVMRTVTQYNGLNAALEPSDGRGWGLVPAGRVDISRRHPAGSLRFVSVECRDSGGADFLAAIATLPIPGVSYLFAAGQWIVGVSLSSMGSSADCGRNAVLRMPLHVNRRGRISVGDADATLWHTDKVVQGDMSTIKLKQRRISVAWQHQRR